MKLTSKTILNSGCYTSPYGKVMSSYKYGFVNARIGAMKSYLLDNVEIKTLIESRNFDDALALLKNTPYGKELTKLSSPSLVDIENVLSKSMLADYEKLVRSVTGIPKTFLAHYAKKFGIDSLKLLLIMKSKGEEIKKYPWIMERIMTGAMAEKLVEMETPEDVVETLRFTEYYPILHEALSEYNEQGTPYPFIAALDAYQYRTLDNILKQYRTLDNILKQYRAPDKPSAPGSQHNILKNNLIFEKIKKIKIKKIKKMSGRDRNIAEHLIGIEIDAKNLLTVLRIRGADEKEALNWLIPMRYRITDSDLMAAFNVKRLIELPQILKRYAGIISEGIEEYEKTQSLFTLEQGFRKYILKENNRVFCGDRLHLGVPLAYLNLKENEVRNLTAILHGKEEDLSVEQIEETVTLLT